MKPSRESAKLSKLLQMKACNSSPAHSGKYIHAHTNGRTEEDNKESINGYAHWVSLSIFSHNDDRECDQECSKSIFI